MTAKHFVCMCISVVILAAAATVACSQAESEFRTWTDSTGKFSVEAEFVELKDGQVVLRRRDDETTAVPLNRLSRADREFVRRAVAAQRRRQAELDKAAEQAADASADAEQDWPQWRGPNRDGISNETGLLGAWPDEGPTLLWKISGLGRGYSSVAVAGGKIFTMGKVGGQVQLIALNEQDGSPLWSTPVGGGSDPNCTPTVDGNLVFGLSHAGDLLCADVASGDVVWRKNFGRDFGGRMMSGWGYSESPLVDGDKLVCTPGSSRAMMAALDKQTGREIWTTAMPQAGSRGKDGAGYSSIVISHAAGVRQYVQLVGRGVISVDADSGRLLWGYNRIANDTANIPTPIVKDDFVFCSSGYHTGVALLRISGSRGRLNAQEIYFKEGQLLQNHHGGMILVGDHVYMGHGHNNGLPVCVDMASGRALWGPGRGPGSGSAAITYADGHLYFRYENGVMGLIEATPRGYNLKGSFKIAVNNGRSWPHPVISRGRLYLRDQNDLVCYDVRE